MSEQQRDLMSEREMLMRFNELLPSPPEMDIFERIAEIAGQSGFLAKEKASTSKAIFIMMKGEEIGVKPIQALTDIDVVNGKPTLEATLMHAMILKNIPSARIKFIEVSNTRCKLIASREADKSDQKAFDWTVDDAIRAGLLRKDKDGNLLKGSGSTAWIGYTKDMLRSRCISHMARTMFPDALMGIYYTSEEVGGKSAIDKALEFDSKPVIEEPIKEVPVVVKKQSEKKKKTSKAKVLAKPVVEITEQSEEEIFEEFENMVEKYGDDEE